MHMKREFPFPTEGIFFRMADEQYRRAMEQAGKVRRYSAPRCYVSFHGFPRDEGLGFAVAALVGWATSIEACVNDLYNKHVAPAASPRLNPSRRSRNVNTLLKLKKLLQAASIAPRAVSWWPEIAALFQLRPELVQLSSPMIVGPSLYAPVLRLKLTERLLTNTRSAAVLALDQLATLYPGSVAHLNFKTKSPAMLSMHVRKCDSLPSSSSLIDEDDIPY